MSKLPALQFYPGDWKKDPGVQALSYEERGIWFEMLLMMHEASRRGYLILNGKAMTDQALARTLRLPTSKVIKVLDLLLTLGVASRDEETGAIYNRRMVSDENLRTTRASAGKLGGRPKAKRKQKQTKPESKIDETGKQNLTPSSSSSSSISSSSSDLKNTSPVYAGCVYFRMSEAELVNVQDWYHAQRLPLELIGQAVHVVESWLANDENATAVKARKSASHFRRLYAPWVLEQAVQAAKTLKDARGEAPAAPRFPDRMERQKAREAAVPDQVEAFMADHRERLQRKALPGSAPTRIAALLPVKK